MRIIDITRPLSSTTVSFPGDPPPRFTQMDAGLYLISDLHMNSHSGTHIDAPVHYLKTGDTIDKIPLDHLIGPCRILNVTAAGNTITAADLTNRLGSAKRILLKTSFSTETQFREDFPHLALDAALLLRDQGALCVGIDSFSIETFVCDGSVHRRLLEGGCIIIELLNLAAVEEGDYEMAALPLRLTGLDGAPARVVLISKDEK
ncbi:cyclase family protein [Methanoregula sp.]|uniref:cyclase family protein n=1 Tax=Methanoregula sp. TaxID=2052170 RepID=UPI002CB934F6|nr:cyclase family protein [Methanoregula sp.]HVP96569.1 cyclase family protein [Methanoregula sp.]